MQQSISVKSVTKPIVILKIIDAPMSALTADILHPVHMEAGSFARTVIETLETRTATIITTD